MRLGLGTDSLASNESLDLFAEAAAAYALWQRQAGAAFDPRAAARRILRWLTIEGAQALGLERELGSITVGKYADLVVVAPAAPPAIPDIAKQLCTGVRADRCTVYSCGRRLSPTGAVSLIAPAGTTRGAMLQATTQQ